MQLQDVRPPFFEAQRPSHFHELMTPALAHAVTRMSVTRAPHRIATRVAIR